MISILKRLYRDKTDKDLLQYHARELTYSEIRRNLERRITELKLIRNANQDVLEAISYLQNMQTLYLDLESGIDSRLIDIQIKLREALELSYQLPESKNTTNLQQALLKAEMAAS
jgi:hypothetical protein